MASTAAMMMAMTVAVTAMTTEGKIAEVKKLFLMLCFVWLLPVCAFAQSYELAGSGYSVTLPDDWHVGWQEAVKAKTAFFAEFAAGKIKLFVEQVTFSPALAAGSYENYTKEQKDLLMQEVDRRIVLGNINAQIYFRQFILFGGQPALLVFAEDGSAGGRKATLVQAVFLKNSQFWQFSFLTDDYNDEVQKQINNILHSFG